MSVFKTLTQPLRQLYAAIFRRHLSVRVAKGGVQLRLRDDPHGPAHLRTPSRAELAARKEQQEFALIQIQLAELLSDLPETRATLRHLVFVEQALERKGLRALHKLPLDVLQRALEQLEGLVVNWSPVGLAALRSKMAVAIIDREHQSDTAEADAYQTAAVIDTMPIDELKTGLEVSTDEDALTAAYAALGSLAPPAAAAVVLTELGSPSARVLSREQARESHGPMGELKLREVQG